MNKQNSFEQFLATQSVDISITGFIINLTLAAVLTLILSLLYQRYARALSNRKRFAANFMMIGVTTMIIITIVKSSLALSLGLVGALSIVRFRAAIKEPEELAYIFFTIAIGLGLGADQRIITLVGFMFLTIMIFLSGYFRKSNTNDNILITVAGQPSSNGKLDKIVNVLKEHCEEVNLTRMDENDSVMEAAFWVEFQNYQSLSNAKNALKEIDPKFAISLLDQKGLN